MAAVVVFMSPWITRRTWCATVIVIAAAMFSDALDGYLARRWRVTTAVGYVLDAMGDRSIHLALILTVLIHHQVNVVLAWLLILRDIAIYAVRVLTPDWLAKSRKLQWLSRVHATILRVWLASYYVRDGIRVFTGRDPLDVLWFECTQMLLVTFTIALSYYGLTKSFGWITDDSREALGGSGLRETDNGHRR